MALQSKLYTRIPAGGQVILDVTMVSYADDYRVINDDGDPDDFRVAYWVGFNRSDRDLTITIEGKNGRPWRTCVIPAGGEFTQAAGGQVKYEFDVPRWSYS